MIPSLAFMCGFIDRLGKKTLNSTANGLGYSEYDTYTTLIGITGDYYIMRLLYDFSVSS